MVIKIISARLPLLHDGALFVGTAPSSSFTAPLVTLVLVLVLFLFTSPHETPWQAELALAAAPFLQLSCITFPRHTPPFPI